MQMVASMDDSLAVCLVSSMAMKKDPHLAADLVGDSDARSAAKTARRLVGS